MLSKPSTVIKIRLVAVYNFGHQYKNAVRFPKHRLLRWLWRCETCRAMAAGASYDCGVCCWPAVGAAADVVTYEFGLKFCPAVVATLMAGAAVAAPAPAPAAL